MKNALCETLAGLKPLIGKFLAAMAVCAAVTNGNTQAAQGEPAATTAKASPSLAAWLKDYIPKQYPGATIEDHGGWVQARVPGGLVVSWAQWNEAGITLKGLEAHALKDGRSIFVSKDQKENWGESPSVVYYKGAGYYIAEYFSASMSGWNAEKSTVIQFDGDSKKFAEQMANRRDATAARSEIRGDLFRSAQTQEGHYPRDTLGCLRCHLLDRRVTVVV